MNTEEIERRIENSLTAEIEREILIQFPDWATAEDVMRNPANMLGRILRTMTTATAEILARLHEMQSCPGCRDFAECPKPEHVELFPE